MAPTPCKTSVDFAADGDQLGDSGYNSAGNEFKLVNFDASADANARLAYGPQGVGAGQWAAGDGGRRVRQPDDQPRRPAMRLNPTIVIRAGICPVQRPNWSGAGAKALAADANHFITFHARPHAKGRRRAAATFCPARSTASRSGPSRGNADGEHDERRPVSAQQLKLVYRCADTTWTPVGGTSSDAVIPIVPQVGSGTRQSFLAAIGNATFGRCVQTGEENDPTAIAAQSNPADAIEPMSSMAS